MNYSWIIENELMVSSLPDSETMLRLLKSAGVKAIVSAHKIPFSQEKLKEFGFFHKEILVSDFHKPTLSQLKEFIRWVTFMHRMKQPVLVHCMAGYGRSATLCVCYLIINRGFTADEAIEEIRDIRSENAIETAEQVGFVHEAEYVKELIADKTEQEFFDAKQMIELLRAWCPWDAKQTSVKLVENLLEETYEVWEAVLSGKSSAISNELGDIFLLVLMIAQIQSETAGTDISSVINSMLRKLKRRHPHVFTDKEIDDSDGVLKQWGEIKAEEEKPIKNISDIPAGIPSLGRAERIMSHAKSLGFDWEEVAGVVKKFEEETNELKSAISANDESEIKNELGDVFFTLLNLARFLKINPELALSETLNKFVKRFSFIENESEKNGKAISEMTLDEMESIWNKSKAED